MPRCLEKLRLRRRLLACRLCRRPPPGPGMTTSLALAAGAVDDVDGLGAGRRLGRLLGRGLRSRRPCRLRHRNANVRCRRRRRRRPRRPGDLVATTTIGSPPSGSLTKAAHTTTTTPTSPSRPARICGVATGSFGSRLFFLVWPRGAFRSSASTAHSLPNHALQDLAHRESWLSYHAGPLVNASPKRTGRPEGRPAANTAGTEA